MTLDIMPDITKAEKHLMYAIAGIGRVEQCMESCPPNRYARLETLLESRLETQEALELLSDKLLQCREEAQEARRLLSLAIDREMAALIPDSRKRLEALAAGRTPREGMNAIKKLRARLTEDIKWKI